MSPASQAVQIVGIPQTATLLGVGEIRADQRDRSKASARRRVSALRSKNLTTLNFFGQAQRQEPWLSSVFSPNPSRDGKVLPARPQRTEDEERTKSSKADVFLLARRIPSCLRKRNFQQSSQASRA